MTLFGTVELGGTKTDVAVGTSIDDISEPHRLNTTTPEETLAGVVAYLKPLSIDALGLASFGPLNLDVSGTHYGTMLTTPKPGWSGFAVYTYIASALDVPVWIDTDVNGAARGEGRWGAAQGMSHFAYMTIGTGIGAGIVVDGQPIAHESHPEVGHIVVRRIEGDVFEGNCPAHGDCLEGMAAGPALEARFGDHRTWAGDTVVLDTATDYVAQGVRNIVYTAATERVIIGGGVSQLPGFHERIRFHVAELLADYPRPPDLETLISKPGLGTLSGLAGGLVLAARALEQ